MRVAILLTALGMLGAASARAEWPITFTGSHSRTEGLAIKTDTHGNVVTLGEMKLTSHRWKPVIAKFNVSGELLWSREPTGYNGLSVFSFDIGPDDSIFFLGKSYAEDQSDAYLTTKFSKDGLKQWQQAISGDGNGYETPGKIVALPDGGCVASGTAFSATNHYDILTARYGANGAKQWARQTDIDQSIDYFKDLAVDELGNIFVTGFDLADNVNLFVLKFDSAGHKKWLKQYDGNVNKSDGGNSLAVDNEGGVVVGGYTTDPDLNSDGLMISYNANGNKRWTQRYYLGSTKNAVRQVQQLPNGNIVALVAKYNQPNGTAYLVDCYDSNGNMLWSRDYSQPVGDLSSDFVMRTDAAGNVYLSGTYYNETGYIDSVKFSATGTKVWSRSFTDHGSLFCDATYDPIHHRYYMLAFSAKSWNVGHQNIWKY